MTHVVAIADRSGDLSAEWPWQVWAVLLVALLIWAAVVERRRNIRRARHVHYFSDADGACQSPGCTVVRRNRRSTPDAHQ